MPVRLSRTVCLHLCLTAFAFSGPAQAASTPSTTSAVAQEDNAFHYRSDRQVIVYQSGHLLSQEGGWREGEALRQVAAANSALAGGNFILFQDGQGPIRQLVAPSAIARVQAAYAPMEALNVQQSAFAKQQKPLAAQQSALATAMKAAATPAQMGEIGREQGRIGHIQGQIGHEQGIIGQQQGTVGRAFYTQLQTVIDACLHNGTCSVVATSH